MVNALIVGIVSVSRLALEVASVARNYVVTRAAAGQIHSTNTGYIDVWCYCASDSLLYAIRNATVGGADEISTSKCTAWTCVLLPLI
jgi:hypothetical protein